MSDQLTNILLQAEQANVSVSTQLPITNEGKILSYVSLILMAVLPIFYGSIRSVKYQSDQKNLAEQTGEQPETMSHKDAMIFPITASLALSCIYLIIKAFSKEYVNMLLTGYFVVLGISALFTSLRPLIAYIKVLTRFTFQLSKHKKQTIDGEEEQSNILKFTFNFCDIILSIMCALVGALYCYEKHWLTNNVFAIAFSINGIELLFLNSVSIGCTLLFGLFIYDIFWVFGTDVMLTVAKSFEAPIKLLFPHDFLQHGINGKQFAMLGLGDVVIPGIFIALLLRFDVSLKKQRKTYFYTSLFAYTMGLIVTIVVMIFFNHAQPALLYLVPACIICPISVALVKGELKEMFAYKDHVTKTKKETPKLRTD